jgi:biopolymer transport protein ExbB/TolQ
LIAAIPALVAFAIFQNKTEQIVTKVTESVSELYHDLLFYTENDADNTKAEEIIPQANNVSEVSTSRN